MKASFDETSITINQSRAKDYLFGTTDKIRISGFLTDADDGNDDQIGDWSFSLPPLSSYGTKSTHSAPYCDSTLHYRIEKVKDIFGVGKGVFDVKSVDHAQGNIGKYFNFNVDEVDVILGHTGWSGITVQVRNDRTGRVSKVVLWRSNNGGSVGNGHGRWDDGTAAPGQWMVGDKVTVLP